MPVKEKLKSLIADFFRKVGSGFVYGLGIAIALVVVLGIASAVASKLYSSKAQEQKFQEQLTGYKAYSTDAGLEIVSHESRRAGKTFVVIGKVKNRGADTWQSVNMEVELFAANRKFVDNCHDYISGAIRPGEEKNFKVECRRCDDAPLPAFKTYEVKIVDASYQRDMTP